MRYFNARQATVWKSAKQQTCLLHQYQAQNWRYYRSVYNHKQSDWSDCHWNLERFFLDMTDGYQYSTVRHEATSTSITYTTVQSKSSSPSFLHIKGINEYSSKKHMMPFHESSKSNERLRMASRTDLSSTSAMRTAGPLQHSHHRDYNASLSIYRCACQSASRTSARPACGNINTSWLW